MRVAALYDIHGHLPALEAVLGELRGAAVDAVVVGGDVLPGPMPREALERLRALDRPVHFVHGNGERAVLAWLGAPDESSITYWGTVSGKPMPEEHRPAYRWTARHLRPEDQAEIARWPRTLRLEVDGLGQVLFCHATPRSETELFTRRTPVERLAPIVDGLGVAAVVCGHTHMPFERPVGKTRVINPGSVGQPYGEPGAHWALLGPDVRPRRTLYDTARAAERIRATGYPGADAYIHGFSQPCSEDEMLDMFASWELK